MTTTVRPVRPVRTAHGLFAVVGFLACVELVAAVALALRPRPQVDAIASATVEA